jgi:hypothetical protein
MLSQVVTNTTKFLGQDCVYLENQVVNLLVTQSVGPRIISLRFNGGDNLFAELPDYVTDRPDGKSYHFYGGHRLWHAPEAMPRTYSQDDQPVDIAPTSNGLLITQPVDIQTGIEKSIQISLVENKPQVIVQHVLTNHGLWPVECAPWAITQFKTGGVAILPQSLIRISPILTYVGATATSSFGPKCRTHSNLVSPIPAAGWPIG